MNSFQSSPQRERVVRNIEMREETSPLQIAIDGPVAAGKGDIAQRLAGQLGMTYLYTGAMYRALALACVREGIDLKDQERVLQKLNQIDISFLPADPKKTTPYTLLLNGEDITEAIFDPEIAQGSSDVSVISKVRKEMVDRQQQLAQGKSVVMEGRDIGKRVLPNAQLKVFLTASVEVRAQRRQKQSEIKGIRKTFEEVLEETKKRDEQDMTREADPLEQLSDHWVLDSTYLNQDQVVEKIVEELKRRNLI